MKLTEAEKKQKREAKAACSAMLRALDLAAEAGEKAKAAKKALMRLKENHG